MVSRPPFTAVDEVLDALASLEGRPSEDVVPTLPHLLQTAELLAVAHPGDDELIVAGLLHDVASGLDPGCGDHPAEGARLVAPLLGPRVAALIAGHAQAKRYLVTVEPAYADGLSENSTVTLVGQGGPMTGDEVRRFESGPHAAALVVLRRADDAAKVPDRTTPPPTRWRSHLERIATAS